MPNGYLNGPGVARLRRGRISIPGQIYLVTFSTHRRKFLFDDFDTACVAARSLTDQRTWSQSSLLAWVLMPDHWHGVIQLGERETLSALICRLKATSARAIGICRGIAAPIWASGFHDHALRRDEDLRVMARYVVRNPVRAGLVRSVLEYPFWNAVWF